MRFSHYRAFALPALVLVVVEDSPFLTLRLSLFLGDGSFSRPRRGKGLCTFCERLCLRNLSRRTDCSVLAFFQLLAFIEESWAR